MPRPTSRVTMGLEGVAEGEVDDFRRRAWGGVDRGLWIVKGMGDGLEIVEFAGYGEGFVVFGVDCFGEGIARRVFNEEVEEFWRELRDKTPGTHLSIGGCKSSEFSFENLGGRDAVRGRTS